LKRSRVPFQSVSSFPSLIRDYISHLRGQLGGAENHPHIFFSGPEILKLLKGNPSYKNKIKGLLYAECFSTSPIKPSFELGRSFTAMLNKKYFLKYLNLYIPALKGEDFISL
jgi:hypothetical protein